MFLILVGILLCAVILLIYQKLRAVEQQSLYYLAVFTIISCLVLLPFEDPLQLPGYFAAALQEKSFFSLFGAMAGLITINIAIYGFAIFYMTMELSTGERFKGKLLTIKTFKKRRYPTFASYHLIGSSYFLLMGSPIGLIIFTLLMILPNFEIIRLEKKHLAKFGDSFLAYKKNVPRRIYSKDILCLLLVNYGLILIGITGIVFFT